MELQIHQIKGISARHYKRKENTEHERGWVAIEITVGNYGAPDYVFEITFFTAEDMAFGQALADGINTAALHLPLHGALDDHAD